MNKDIQAIILAAGASTRFNTEKTKLAATICGQEMIIFLTKLLETLEIPTTIVVGYQQETIKKIIENHHNNSINFVVQEQQKGTGHALECSKEYWHADNILVINGDCPLIMQETIEMLYHKHHTENAAISFVTSHKEGPTSKPYGKVIIKNDQDALSGKESFDPSTGSGQAELRTNGGGKYIEIVEAKDFNGDPTQHHCINAGIYLIKKDFLLQYINNLTADNASKEFYITDLVKIASHNAMHVTTVDVPFDTIAGINTLEELHHVEQIKRNELIHYWMDRGVRFSFPQNNHIDVTVRIDKNSFIGSGVHLRGNTVIAENCTIGEYTILDNVILEENVTIYPHSIIKNTHIEADAQVGPFAHLRNNVHLGSHTIIGNFVEIKNSNIEKNSMAKHLTYIGDATIGENVNIGAGTITCNYDGVTKHKTTIKNNAFVGSNNTIIAPVVIGENAYTAAGSTITTDVPDNALAIARSHQINKDEHANRLRPDKTDTKKTISQPQEKVFSFMAARVLPSDNPSDEI